MYKKSIAESTDSKEKHTIWIIKIEMRTQTNNMGNYHSEVKNSELHFSKYY